MPQGGRRRFGLNWHAFGTINRMDEEKLAAKLKQEGFSHTYV
jgi:hypothetical protein